MAPYWRKMSNTLEKTDRTMNGLLDRSQIIDSKMEQYEEALRLVNEQNKAVVADGTSVSTPPSSASARFVRRSVALRRTLIRDDSEKG